MRRALIAMRRALINGLGFTFLAIVTLGQLLTLAAQGQDDKMSRLMDALADRDRAVVLSAMKKLGSYGAAGKGAVAALCGRLSGSDKDLSRHAARALAQIGAPAVQDLVKLLKRGKPEIQSRVLLVLGTIGRESEEALGPVRNLLESSDERIRFLAALVLGAMHEEARPAASALAKALRDPDPRVRLVAADSLFQLGTDMATRLADVVESNEELSIRLNALAGLSKFLDSGAALKTLEHALQDPEAKIRAAAASSLARLRGLAKPTLPKLMVLLKDKNQEVQASAFRAISALEEGRDVSLRDKLTALNQSCSWADATLAKSLGKGGKLNKDLERMLFSTDATERVAGALALAKRGASARPVQSFLTKCCSDPDHSVRAAAALALCTIGSKKHKNLAELGKHLDHAVEEQRGSSDSAELVRLHMVFSALPPSFCREKSQLASQSVRSAATLAKKALDEHHFSLDELPALVKALNLIARFDLGFTEPFNSLAFKLQTEVQESKSRLPALLVFRNLGSGVPADSLHWAAIQQQWALAISRLPVEEMIFAKQQSILSDSVEAAAASRFLTDFS